MGCCFHLQSDVYRLVARAQFPPSAFLESICLNDLTQNEKACLPNQTGAQEGKASFVLLRPTKGVPNRLLGLPGSGFMKIPG